jgi:allantoin racemase
MTHIILINPNTSEATTAMMTDIAGKYLPKGVTLEGLTALKGVPMILDDEQLGKSTDGVVEMGLSRAGKADGIIISAFGDPGLERLREISDIPVVGICEASMLEANLGGRRFGIATVTPHLVDNFAQKADVLGVSRYFTGTRLTIGDPLTLASDPERLYASLAIAVRECFENDGAEAVIIGGGPLGQVAEDLQNLFSAPIIAPIRSAVELLLSRLGGSYAKG